MSVRRWIALLAGTGASLLVAAAAAWIHPAFAEPAASPDLTAPHADSPAAPTARAVDPRLRPNDLAPDLRVLPPSDPYLVDDRGSGGSLRLKFTTVVWNAGDGPMEIRGSPVEGEGLRVRQIVHSAAGGMREAGTVGRFDFDHRHGHVHLSSFARYELWSLDGDRPVDRVAANRKVGFCLMDNLRVDHGPVVADGGYAGSYDAGCDAGVQGISPGWGDRYVAQLYEQDLVIDGLPDGRYRLVNIANPDGVLAEARLDNNDAAVDVLLAAGTVRIATGE